MHQRIAAGELRTAENVAAANDDRDLATRLVSTLDLGCDLAGFVRANSTPNQAFALGKHFGFQCHVEMTAELVRKWCALGGEEIQTAAGSPAVQPPEEIERDLEARIEALHKVADRVYERWIVGLAKG